MKGVNLSKWIKENWIMLERVSKLVLGERWREGVSEFYIYLEKTNKKPGERFTYYFMMNLRRRNSAINYKPITFGEGEMPDIHVSPENAIDLMIDLDDEVAVDFLLNNENNERWLKIYNIVYRGGIELDLFEKILFEYIFLKGMSIRDIVKITGNSQDYIYKQRRKLIEKIKMEI